MIPRLDAGLGTVSHQPATAALRIPAPPVCAQRMLGLSPFPISVAELHKPAWLPAALLKTRDTHHTFPNANAKP